MESSDLKALEQELGYCFNDHSRVLQALTHPSFEHEQAGGGNYQRLEFLGDAVLGMVLAETLYQRFPVSNEGVLSRFRSQVADQDTLAGIARSFGLGRFVRLGRGEEQGAGRDKDSILADVLEALIAAVYLDGGLEEARRLIQGLFDDILANREATLRINDAKSELQELLCARRLPSPLYRLSDESGPPTIACSASRCWWMALSWERGRGAPRRWPNRQPAAQALEKIPHHCEAS